MSHYETKMLEAVESIALSLSRIANKMCLGHVPVEEPTVNATATTEMLDSLRHATAVQALIDMPNDLPPEAPKGKPATKEEVVSALNGYSRVHGVAAAKAVLTQYGATLGDVPAEKYGELVALLKATK